MVVLCVFRYCWMVILVLCCCCVIGSGGGIWREVMNDLC